MQNLKTIFNGADEVLDSVEILPVGSYGAGSYSLPSGYTWGDFEYVEMAIGIDGNTFIYEDFLISKELLNSDFDLAKRLFSSTGAFVASASITKSSVSSLTLEYIAGTSDVHIKQIKGYTKRYGVRNHSKTVYVNEGADIAVDSRYEIDIATELGTEYLNRDLIVEVEILNNSGTGVEDWGDPNWVEGSDGNSIGVKCGVVGNKIAVQTGQSQLTGVSTTSGNPFGNTVGISSAPCRIKIWKVEEYLPATKSSGDITTIWTGSAGNSETVDWSSTGYALSQFDAILLVDNIQGVYGYTTIPTSRVLSDSLSWVGVAYGTTDRLYVLNKTETSLVVDAIGVVGNVLKGIYGINYN